MNERYTVKCTGCGMEFTGITKKIAYWHDDHRGDCSGEDSELRLVVSDGHVIKT